MSDDLVVLDVVQNEPEAELLVSLLQSTGIAAMQRLTTMGGGAADGFPTGGGAREILVRADQLERARDTLEKLQRGAG